MSSPQKIDIGCGKHKKKRFYGIDKFYFDGVDEVCDIDKGLTLEDNSVDEVYTSHFLEHIENLEFVFKEILRVCKPNGKIIIRVPHFSGDSGFYEFHKRFFRYGSFTDFTNRKDGMLSKSNVYIKIIKKKLIFLRKRYLPLNPLIESFFNSNEKFITLYEKTFLRNLFPAQEMYFEMKVIKK